MTRRPGNVLPAGREVLVASVETFSEKRNGAAEMAQHPANAGKALRHAGKDQVCRGERGVEEKAAERHQPVILHCFDAERKRRMDVEHRAGVAGALAERPVLLAGQRIAVDVAEQHAPLEAELHDAVELDLGGGRVVERQRGERGEAVAAFAHDGREGVVDQPGQRHRSLRGLEQGAGAGERDYLPVDAVAVEHLLPVGDVPVPADGDVDVPRRVEHRIAVGVVADGQDALVGPQRLQERRRVEVVVDIDHGHGRRSFRGRGPPKRGRKATAVKPPGPPPAGERIAIRRYIPGRCFRTKTTTRPS